MKHLSNDRVLDARQALAEHTDAMKPSNNLAVSATQNDWTRFASRTTVQPLDLNAARAAAHERIRKENATKQNQ